MSVNHLCYTQYDSHRIYSFSLNLIVEIDQLILYFVLGTRNKRNTTLNK